MKYAFILGRVYTLSVAELIALLEKPDQSLVLAPLRAEVSEAKDEAVKILEASEEVLVIETPAPLNVANLQKKLGGVIKILQVEDIIKKRENDSINFALKHYFKPSVLKKQFFKEYKGKNLEVKILESGFEYRGKVYKTLTAIAKDVTGAHWNGYLFFNL